MSSGLCKKVEGAPDEYILTSSLVLSDFNNDGRPDIAYIANWGPVPIAVILNNGDGTFTHAPPQPPTSLVSPLSMTTGDFNGDGIFDLAIVDSASNSLKVLLGNGDGTFTEKDGEPVLNNGGVFIRTTDLNGDGKLDLGVVDSGDTVSIYLGNGDGTFQAGASVATGKFPFELGFGDFNGDGRMDLAVVNWGAIHSPSLSNCQENCPVNE